MIQRIVFIFLIFTSLTHAYFLTTNNLSTGNRVLKSFDIEPSYLTSSMYTSTKYLESHFSTVHFLKVLREGQDIVPMLKTMLKNKKVPEIFLYLAMAESNFHLHAKSNSRAVGLWQFMKRTAQNFGLRIDKYVDERKDPIKSTEAAIKYLKYLHNMFGKWYLAAMAYNCGEAKIRKAIKEAKSDNIAILLSEKEKYIPRETRRYIGKILAMATISLDESFILENDADYLLNQGQNNVIEKVNVPANTSLGAIAKTIGISTRKLKEYNSHLRYYFTPPNSKKYHVYLPYGKGKLFKQRFKPDEKANKYKQHRYYIIRKGDSLYSIAKKHHISISLLREYNYFRKKYLKIGQKIIIPSEYKDFKSEKVRVGSAQKEYIVKKGDTLGSISLRFKVKISDIREINKKRNSFIKIGERIVIPSK